MRNIEKDLLRYVLEKKITADRKQCNRETMCNSLPAKRFLNIGFSECPNFSLWTGFRMRLLNPQENPDVTGPQERGRENNPTVAFKTARRDSYQDLDGQKVILDGRIKNIKIQWQNQPQIENGKSKSERSPKKGRGLFFYDFCHEKTRTKRGAISKR